MVQKFSLKSSHVESRIFQTTREGETIDLKKLYNFEVDRFFIWSHLSKENCIKVLTFEIQKFQTTSDEEIIKTKSIDLKRLYNFVGDNIFIWIHLGFQKIKIGWI
jgi:hypothetical protein